MEKSGRLVLYGGPFVNSDGSVRGPVCCGNKMQDDGGCAEGCCDDYKCEVCGKRV